jgi:Cof subfamily protein (haloacid dehalogenase superfamily)
MNRIALVVSDVDGTLVTPDKQLTMAARRAVQRLQAANIGFTLTSSRPPLGMRMLLAPLAITLPIGPFNGSTIVDPQLNVLVQHVIPPDAAQRGLKVCAEFAVDVWLFTTDRWLILKRDGDYVDHEARTVDMAPVVVTSLDPFLAHACKIVGVSADPERLQRCEAAMQATLGDSATAIRSQKYYLDITPPGQNKGVFVTAMAQRLGIPTQQIATIGDMANDVPMFKASGVSVAMGNASADVQAQATHVTGSNQEDGFAHAIDIILDLHRNA